MLLKPLRFANAQELHHFLLRLHQLKLLSVTLTSNPTIANDFKEIEPLTAQLLSSTDGNMYLLTDVQEFLQAKKNESSALVIDFFKISSCLAPLRRISLDQINSYPKAFSPASLDCALLLANLNLNLYDDSFFALSLNSKKQIKIEAKFWCEKIEYLKSNEKFSPLCRVKSLHENYFKKNKLPPVWKMFNFINPLGIDIYKITFFQLEKLSTNLEEIKLEFNQNNSVQTALNEWLKAITAYSQLINQHLMLYRDILELYQQRKPYPPSLYMEKIAKTLFILMAGYYVNEQFSEPKIITWSSAMTLIGSLYMLRPWLPGFVTNEMPRNRSESSNLISDVVLADLLNHLDQVIRRISAFLADKAEVLSPQKGGFSLSDKKKIFASIEKNNLSGESPLRLSNVYSDIRFFAYSLDNSSQETAGEGFKPSLNDCNRQGY